MSETICSTASARMNKQEWFYVWEGADSDSITGTIYDRFEFRWPREETETFKPDLKDLWDLLDPKRVVERQVQIKVKKSKLVPMLIQLGRIAEMCRDRPEVLREINKLARMIEESLAVELAEEVKRVRGQ